MSEITKKGQQRMLCTGMSLMPLEFYQATPFHFNKTSVFFTQHLHSREIGAYIIERVTCEQNIKKRNMKSNSCVRETSHDGLSAYLVVVAIEDEIAAELTARAMGWVPLEGDEGIRIWVRSEDIGVDDAPYCNTALEVVRIYTH